MSDRAGAAAEESDEDFGSGSVADVADVLARRLGGQRTASVVSDEDDDDEEQEERPLRRPARGVPNDDDAPELEAEADADVDEDPDADAEEEPEEDADDAGEQLTLERLAKHWKMKPEDVGKAIMVADAQGKLVPLEAALSAYRQPPPDRVQHTRDMEELGRFRQVDNERQRTFESGMRDLGMLTQALLTDYNGEAEPDWAAMREHNPTEYSVKKIAYEERKKRLEAALGLVQNAQRNARDRQAAQLEERAREQARLLQSSNPDWKDARKFRTALEGMGDYLRSIGYTDEQIAGVSDHRDWIIVGKAMAYDARATKDGALKKRLGQIPRVPTLRAGSQAVDTGTPRVERELARTEDKALARLKKSGSDADAEGAVLARMLSGRARRARGRRG